MKIFTKKKHEEMMRREQAARDAERAREAEFERKERQFKAEKAQLEAQLYQKQQEERMRVANRQRQQEQERHRQEQERRKHQESEYLRMMKLKQTTPESLRKLRDLIRTRYELDLDIWGLRGARSADQRIVIEKGRKSDAVLEEIYRIVDTWDESSGWTEAEWQVAQMIKQQLRMPGKRIWESNPPWQDG